MLKECLCCHMYCIVSNLLKRNCCGLLRSLSQGVPMRVPGLPIRDCTRCCYNRSPRWLKLSAVDVTKRTFFLSVCISFQDCTNLFLVSTFPMHPQPPPLTRQPFLDYCAIFFPERPLHFFGHSPSNLAKSQYPRPGTLVLVRGYRDSAKLLGESC